MKRLYKSTKDKMLCGVCGGLAEYINIDPTIVRILWALLSLATVGTGIIAYLVLAIIMPDAPTNVE